MALVRVSFYLINFLPTSLLLFICLGGRFEDAHSCEIVPCLAMRQYVKKTEKVSADSPRDRHDCREEQVVAQEEVALVVVVLVVVELQSAL